MIVHAPRVDDQFVGLRKRGAPSSLRLRARATREVESANSRPSAFCAAGGRSVTREPPSGELSGESCVRFLRIGEASHRRHPELAELIIVRQSLEYRYTLPSTWDEATGGTQCALHHLVGELVPLLNDLTGPVAVQHLAQIRELQEWGIVAPQEEGS
jgi:hypothetical protein